MIPAEGKQDITLKAGLSEVKWTTASAGLLRIGSKTSQTRWQNWDLGPLKWCGFISPTRYELLARELLAWGKSIAQTGSL